MLSVIPVSLKMSLLGLKIQYVREPGLLSVPSVCPIACMVSQYLLFSLHAACLVEVQVQRFFLAERPIVLHSFGTVLNTAIHSVKRVLLLGQHLFN